MRLWYFFGVVSCAVSCYPVRNSNVSYSKISNARSAKFGHAIRSKYYQMRRRAHTPRATGGLVAAYYIENIKKERLTIMSRSNGFYLSKPGERKKDLDRLITTVKKLVNTRVATVCYLHPPEKNFKEQVLAIIKNHNINPTGRDGIFKFYADILYEINQLSCKSTVQENLTAVLASDLQQIRNV